MRNISDFLVGSLRSARGFDAEDYFRQLAEQGFTHVTINGLGVSLPYESGPPGDVYSWFYDYSPDLDQFVESALLGGFYPREYLSSNLQFLKSNAAFASRSGLTPGLHINSPRSMPDAFWQKYPFLRGARVDHPRESFLPRYTLALSHPIVQQHYRELVRTIMKEVPHIGFFHLWTNDSGSGFEFTSSLYAGRNGGPYLIREWRNDEEISCKAAENVLAYLRILRNEARSMNPEARIICDLGPFYKERSHIIRGLGEGIDAGSFGSFESSENNRERDELRKVKAWTHYKIDVMDNNVLGVPYPRIVHQRLMNVVKKRGKFVLTSVTPRCLAPYDINGEVLRALQLKLFNSLDETLRKTATKWVANKDAQELIDIWNLSDKAVRSCPSGIPYRTFSFPWFRLWVRPFVPNIDAIPEEERAYYERFLLATFNNPTRVDFNNDMMWNFLTVKQAAQKCKTMDERVLPIFEKAIARVHILLVESKIEQESRPVFQDLHVRLKAGLNFYTTLRNVLAWIESVHGYIQSRTAAERKRYRKKAKEMVENELRNSKYLVQLWETSSVQFIPISNVGESLHIYGQNFGELLNKKINLMERHKNDEPFIDPYYMWRMPLHSKKTITG